MPCTVATLCRLKGTTQRSLPARTLGDRYIVLLRGLPACLPACLPGALVLFPHPKEVGEERRGAGPAQGCIIDLVTIVDKRLPDITRHPGGFTFCENKLLSLLL